jgi:hypothetical protein
MKWDMSLAEFIVRYDRGEFDSPDKETMVRAGWYDQFRDPGELKSRLERMMPTIRLVAMSPRVDPSKVYVFFKHNIPMFGELFDSFSVCDSETDAVLYFVAPWLGFHDPQVYGKAQVRKAPDF